MNIEELKTLAEQGDAAAMYDLGVAYDFGDGVEQNHEEAVRWYRLAAEQEYIRTEKAANDGCVDAYIVLGQLLMRKGDREKAIYWFERAMKEGFEEEAKYYLICLYVDNEPQRAIDLYESYDAKKYRDFDGSYLREFGNSCKIKGDYKNAYYWYCKAVEKGNRIAKDEIAKFYEQGLYIEQDINKAIELYKENDTFISRYALQQLNADNK